MYEGADFFAPHLLHTLKEEQETMTLFAKGITFSKKVTTLKLNLIDTPLPKRVILPLKQYIGEASQPVVKAGDTVKAGQLIATAPTDTSLPLHATIAGTVKDITEQPDYKGTPTPCLIIEGDGTDTWIEPSDTKEEEKKDISSYAPSEIIERIHAAGLITTQLVPVPLATDLVPIDQPKTHLIGGQRITKKIDTLIITALDREPFLGVNRYLAGNNNKELVDGITALKIITGAHYVRFVVDTHYPPSTQLKDLVAADEEETTTLTSLNGRRFPIGLAIPLIKAVLGREVPLPYGHPRDVGVALYDMNTAIAVGKAVSTQLPQVDSLITVGGGAMSKKGIVTVRIGTSIGDVIASLGGLSKDTAKIIIGGPMTGMAHYDLTIPITKETDGLFALTHDEIQLSGDYRQCINCGLCVKVCPVNLLPGVLSLYCAKDKFDMAETDGLFQCIECGCCDYVCPSRRPMVHLFRHAKHQLMEA
jgi:electron transport complex protein RnfC